MKRGYLSQYFEGVAVKKLTAVDAAPARSNQHEVGTTVAMRRFIPEEKRAYDATFVWLAGEQNSFDEPGTLTMYDVREKKEHRRPEWRLYYPTNAVTEAMAAGDTLFVAKRTDRTLLFVVTPPDSTAQNQLLWLFGFDSQPEFGFAAHSISGDQDAELDFASRLILEQIGVEYEDPDANSLDAIIERFGMEFPKTRVLSDLARLTLPEVDPLADPDLALVTWLDHEEAMFRRLERRIVAERLTAGFAADGEIDVDGFLHYSLQVQNRRKSRMGRALENHLEAVFRAWNLTFDTQGRTEAGNTADFLFPGVAAYHDTAFPAAGLTMLAAKSTCKDRWRQVLPEAEKIWPKHLLTLEPSISVGQTEQMQRERLQLVVPRSVHETYQPKQREWIIPLMAFIEIVRARGQGPPKSIART